MFEPAPELSTDIEWMLQSGQASVGMLAEALVEEHYPEIYQLALAVTGDQAPAGQVAEETITAALGNVYRYRQETGVRLWLLGVFVEVVRRRTRLQSLRLSLARMAGKAGIRQPETPSDNAVLTGTSDQPSPWEAAFDGLSEQDRLALALILMAGLLPEEVARVMGWQAERGRQTLQVAQGRFVEALRRQGVSEEALEAERLDASLEGILCDRWPVTELSQAEGEAVTARIIQKSGGHRLRRSLSSFQELALTAAGILLVVGVIYFASQLLPEPASGSSGERTVAVQQTMDAMDHLGSYDILSDATPTPGNTALYFLEPGDTIDTVADKFGMSAREIASLNGFQPGFFPPAGTGIYVIPKVAARPLPTPVTPAPRVQTLGASQDAGVVLSYLMVSSSLWNTLWGDARVIEYGPPGYIGPPLEYRSQVWVSQPDQSIELVGPVSSASRYEFLTTGSFSYALSAYSTATSVRVLHPDLLLNSDLRALIFPDGKAYFMAGGAFRMAGSDQIAGRPTLVADWLNPQEVREQRLWIDSQTGVVLRRQVYSANDGETLLEDILFVRVSYDVDIPPELFDPQNKMAGNFYETSLGMQGPTDSTRAGFDPSGTATDRPRLEKSAPSTSIDLANEPLTFQYPQGFQEASLGQNETAVISLFAGDAYLGELAYLDPWESVCDRSPDGTRIAFLYRSARQRFPRSARSPGPLQWVDLTDLGNVHKLLAGYRVESFAFAPDSQRIAFFGQGPVLSQGAEGSTQGLYVVDLASGEETKVTSMAYATSLLWSPDGEYLAMVGMMDNAAKIEAIIVKIPTGEVVYHGALDARILSFQRALAGIALPEDWPAKDWGTFPVQDDGLTRCVAQPGG